MQISIRPAAPTDCRDIFCLVSGELGCSQLDDAAFTKRFGRILAHADYASFVAAEGDKVIGFIGLHKGLAYKREGEYLRITALAVSSARQGKGVGAMLLRRAEAYTLELGMGYMVLSSNRRRVAAHTFYEYNGYAKTRFGFFKSLQ